MNSSNQVRNIKYLVRTKGSGVISESYLVRMKIYRRIYVRPQMRDKKYHVIYVIHHVISKNYLVISSSSHQIYSIDLLILTIHLPPQIRRTGSKGPLLKDLRYLLGIGMSSAPADRSIVKIAS